jgi:hypothetical protein
MADKKLFDGSLVTTPSGTKRVAIGDPSNPAQNITLDNLKKWVTGTTITSLQTKSFNIGTWNMDSTPGKTVTLSGIQLSKIRGVEVIIKSDENEMFPISYPNSNEELSAWYKVCKTPTTNPILAISRKANYFFDQSAFNGSVNRGYVIVTYEP